MTKEELKSQVKKSLSIWKDLTRAEVIGELMAGLKIKIASYSEDSITVELYLGSQLISQDTTRIVKFDKTKEGL